VEGQKKNESSGVPAPRKFQQQWSTDTKYKERLQYDAKKQSGDVHIVLAEGQTKF
jgi:hypothetical protein